MTSFQLFYAWAEKQEGFNTLWRMNGPRNTDIEEILMVAIDGKTAIVTLFKGENGFMVYRSEN